jgi:hypothetical protein
LALLEAAWRLPASGQHEPVLILRQAARVLE